MTPAQEDTLAIIRRLNEREFNSWFRPSWVMAFVQIESAFHAHAYRYEPRLKEGSYGLMQVLASTAKEHGLIGTPDRLYWPENGLRYGMRVAHDYWIKLKALIGRDPTLEEWAVSYNAGVGGAARHIKAGDEGFDAAYAHAWDRAVQFWQAQGVDDKGADNAI